MPFVDARGMRIFHESSGEGEPLVLIAGLGSDHTAFMLAQVPAFAAAGYRCIAIDNRDAGQTGDSPTETYGIRDMADDVAGFLHSSGIVSAHILGWSMGGMIGQELAIHHTPLVRSLTLFGTDAGQNASVRCWVESWMAVREKCTPREMGMVFLPVVFGWRFLAMPGAKEAILGAIDANPYPQSAAAFLRQCRAILAHDTRERLSAIAAPTLVIAGAEDIVQPPRHAEFIAGRIRGSQLTVLPDVAHAAVWENPALFNATVISFLSEHR